jgi:peptide/nickel transport system ATP-binding protein
VSAPLLDVQSLCVDYVTDDGPVRAVDEVSLEVGRGEVLGLAGESGSGKSTLAQAVMRLLPPPGVITGGRVLLEGVDLLGLDEDALRRVRWRRVSMVFQSALDALNPVLSIGEQLEDALVAHAVAKGRGARDQAASLLEMVALPADALERFPHQLSGGMRQRVGIAMALALEPAVVLLDEPTTALDVIVEQEILAQLLELKAQRGFSMVFITHDLARMLQVCERVGVFYSGRLVELAPAGELRAAPRHPYTQGLLRAFPSMEGRLEDRVGIPGTAPSLRAPPPGCRFAPRCPHAMDRCRAESPRLVDGVACFLQDGPGSRRRTGPQGAGQEAEVR